MFAFTCISAHAQAEFTPVLLSGTAQHSPPTGLGPGH